MPEENLPAMPKPIMVTLHDCAIQVGKHEDGSYSQVLHHPSGWSFRIPLAAEDARELARGLTGGIEIAPAGSVPTR